jgi:hypothetical protein
VVLVDPVPPGAAEDRADFDPTSSMTTLHYVLHLSLEVDEAHTPRLREQKSTADDVSRQPVSGDPRVH